MGLLETTCANRSKVVIAYAYGVGVFEVFAHPADSWEYICKRVRQGNVKPFVEEAVLKVSSWGFRLSELKVQKK